MSEAIGFVTVISTEPRGPFMTAHETSEATQQVVDEQIRELIDTAHADVTDLIDRHRDQLETLARTLLKEETLDEADAYAAAGSPSQALDTSGVSIVRSGGRYAGTASAAPAHRNGASEPRRPSS